MPCGSVRLRLLALLNQGLAQARRCYPFLLPVPSAHRARPPTACMRHSYRLPAVHAQGFVALKDFLLLLSLFIFIFSLIGVQQFAGLSSFTADENPDWPWKVRATLYRLYRLYLMCNPHPPVPLPIFVRGRNVVACPHNRRQNCKAPGVRCLHACTCLKHYDNKSTW